MTIDQMLKEHDLSVDDVRWYLAAETARRLLTYRDREFELIRYIWSGQLEDEVYHMAERFLDDLRADLERGLKDPVQVRTLFREVEAARLNRYTESGPGGGGPGEAPG